MNIRDKLRKKSTQTMRHARARATRRVESLAPNFFFIVLGVCIAICGALIWFFNMVAPLSLQLPAELSWVSFALKTTLVLMYAPVAFVIIFSSVIFFKNISRQLDDPIEDTDELPSVPPHRITRMIAKDNTRKLDRVRKRLRDAPTTGGARLLEDDLSDILFDVPRNPLKAIATDHLPRMLLVRRRHFRRFKEKTGKVLYVLSLLGIAILLGAIAWWTDWFIFFLGVVTSIICLVTSLALWEYTRVRYVLTRDKLGFIEWRLFFGGRRQTFILIGTLNQPYAESQGWGQALEKVGMGWGNIEIRTTEHDEILSQITDVSEPEYLFAFIEAARQRIVRTETDDS